jgi:hypothetical protein
MEMLQYVHDCLWFSGRLLGVEWNGFSVFPDFIDGFELPKLT